ncbi:uncharacterized protein [Coffea arabica]|uniref:F-box associated domain-containing protein n=1 Tax=Coffea arabica TaxID=13443 RepID=A0ABM4VGE9_COFAR
MVWKFNSLSPYWKRKFHEEVDPLLNDVHKKYALLGPSVYLNGNLHWLLQPSGVIAYNIENECFDLSFVKVPGDSMHLDDLGLCNCTKRSPENNAENNAAGPRSCVCTCRFLGECEGRLVYTRVTGDSCFSIWILKDYQSRFWIHNYWIVGQLPGSLFDGRVLAFGQKADFVLLRVKKNIFSYNFRTRELKKFHQILKNYAHEDKCEGLLVPYYLPRDHPPVIPLAVRANSPSLSGEGTRESAWPLGRDSTPSNAPMDRLFYHHAVSHLAEKYKIRAGLASRIPLRVKLYVRVHHNSIDSYKWAVSCYSDLIRLEASLHSGCFSAWTRNHRIILIEALFKF